MEMVKLGRAAKLKAERKARREDPEYQRQMKREAMIMVKRSYESYEREFVSKNIYAILSVLVVEFGFGKKRLERYLNAYEKTISDMCEYFSYSIDEVMPECEKVVRATGFNLDGGFWQYKMEDAKK